MGLCLGLEFLGLEECRPGDLGGDLGQVMELGVGTNSGSVLLVLVLLAIVADPSLSTLCVFWLCWTV